MSTRTEMRDAILAHFENQRSDAGRPLYVTRRLGLDGLVIQKRRVFESDAREQPWLVTVKPGPDALRLRDGAVVVSGESAPH